MADNPQLVQPVNLDTSFNFGIKEIALLLRRNIYAILSMIFLTLIIAVVFLAVEAPLYTAKATIQINVTEKKVINIEAVSASMSADELAIVSELDMLQSRFLAAKVIQKLNLEKDPEFNPSLAAQSFLGSIRKYFIAPKEISEEDKKSGVSSSVINNYLDKLIIARKPHSYTITIEFSSRSPQKAKEIANAVVDEYINNQLASKYQATEQANLWLKAKLDDMQKTVHDSEVKVQKFREENNLLETGPNGTTINDQQLSEINSQLLAARAARTQAEAKLSNSRVSIESMPEVLNSGLISSLRGQEAEVQRKKADLSTRYGPKHPKMININAELNDIEQKIQREIVKITNSMQKEVEVQKEKESLLEEALDKLKGQNGSSSRAAVQLAELAREMNANRALYESFLNRFKQTSENKGFEQADARIISAAEIPLSPSYPDPKLFLVIGLLVGTVAGVGLAFILESLDNSFHSARELQEKTGVKVLSMLPELKNSDRIEPTSIYYESMRSVIIAINFIFSNSGRQPKKIMITSSVPEEGKSFFALTFARILAQSGKKVILIDCDLKRASLTQALLNSEVEKDLSEYLSGRATLNEIILKQDGSGMHFIPSRYNITHSQDLLDSDGMRETITNLEREYDYVIFDTPPVMPVSDSLVISRYVDTNLFIVRWGKTQQGMVRSALQQIADSGVHISGILMTRVNFHKHRYYGVTDSGYYHGYYKEYYGRKKKT